MGNYFIRIDDGTDVRRKILESSKASIHILRSYQKLLTLRGEKLALMHGLRRELKDITVLMNHVEELLPALSQEELAQFAPRAPDAPKMVLPKSAPPKKVAKVAPKKKVETLPALPMEKKVYVGAPSIGPKKTVPVPEKQSSAAIAAPQEKQVSPLEQLEQKLAAIEQRLRRV